MHSATDQVSPELDRDLAEFLLDRQARNYTPSTLKWYRRCLSIWQDFCQAEDVTHTEDVTPGHVRRFLVHLSERGHTPGGVVTLYTGVRAFLNWYADEYAPTDWNPLARVKAPKRPQELVTPLSLSAFQAMVDTCTRRTFYGDRARALLYLLLDTGVRHQSIPRVG